MPGRDWLQAWIAEYPDVADEDAMLAPFRGQDYFTRFQVEQLIDWKFRDEANRKTQAQRGIAAETDQRIEELTKQAFACFQDLVAMLAGCELKGLGPASVSVLLMARDPDRFTVIDSRALATLRAFGLLPPGGKFAETKDWEPYLTVCRGLANDSGFPLRQVDRALYTANGRTDLPGPA